MEGNAIQWCHDMVDIPPGSLLGGVVEDTSDETPVVNSKNRILRGAAFFTSATYVRSANRSTQYPVAMSPGIGFRVARTIVRRPDAPAHESLSGRSSETDSWHSLKIPEAGYELKFPVAPTKEVKRSDANDRTNMQQQTKHFAETGGGRATYFFIITDYIPGSIPPESIDDRLDGVLDTELKSLSGKDVYVKRITVNGNPGRFCTFKGTLWSKKFTIQRKNWVIGDRLFQAFIISEPDAIMPADVEKFFGSIRPLQSGGP